MIRLYGFMILMWILILAGGGIFIYILQPLEFESRLIGSIIKGGVAIGLVLAWVFILNKLKKLIFAKAK